MIIVVFVVVIIMIPIINQTVFAYFDWLESPIMVIKRKACRSSSYEPLTTDFGCLPYLINGDTGHQCCCAHEMKQEQATSRLYCCNLYFTGTQFVSIGSLSGTEPISSIALQIRKYCGRTFLRILLCKTKAQDPTQIFLQAKLT